MQWRRHATAAWPFAVLALAYVLTTLRVIGVAGWRNPGSIYWHWWQDQSIYLRSTTALAQGNLDLTQHYYPLLYPLLGVPFVKLWADQPYFVANFVCYLLAFLGFRSVSRAFRVPLWAATLIFAATTLGQFGIAKLWIEPWTTTPAAALLWLALGAMADIWSGGGSSRRSALILGIALGLLPFTRPGDMIIGAIIAVSAGIALLRMRDRASLVFAIAGFIAAIAILFPLYLAIYGPHASPYMLYSEKLGFNFSLFGWKAYILLVDPRGWFGEGMGLLEYAPWLLLGAAGMVAATVTTPVPRRPVVLTVALAASVYTIMMLAYVDLLPPGLWRYNNVHYFKWLFPLFGLFAVRFLLDIRRRPVILTAALPILLALTIRIEPVRVADDAPARMVIFPKPAIAEWAETYFAEGSVTDRRGEQRNQFEYHQVLVRGRVHAFALRRPFAGGESWIGNERIRDQLAGRYTGGFAPLYLTGPWPKTPLARYDAALSFGMPHWFDREANRTGQQP